MTMSGADLQYISIHSKLEAKAEVFNCYSERHLIIKLHI